MQRPMSQTRSELVTATMRLRLWVMQTRGVFETQTRGEFASVTCAGPEMLTTPKGWRCSPPRRVGEAHYPVGLEMPTGARGFEMQTPAAPLMG